MRQIRYTIAQASDPHPRATGSPLKHADAHARLKACVERIVSAGCCPDALVLFGHLADRHEAAARVDRSRVPGLRRRFAATLLADPGHRGGVTVLPTRPLGRSPSRKPLDEVVCVGGLRLIGMDSSVPGEIRGELTAAQLDALANELAEPATDCTVLIVQHPPIQPDPSRPDSVALGQPERLANVIRGTDVCLVLSGHSDHVGLGTVAGIPVWGSPSSGRRTDALAPNGWRPDGGFNRVDIFGDRDMVATFVPLYWREEIDDAFLAGDS
jgi:hypothetical protein